MRTEKIKNLFFLLMLGLALPIQAQLKAPFNKRSEYVVKQYGFTAAEANSYNNVVNAIDKKWNALKDTSCPLANRRQSEKKLSEELCRNVKSVLSPAHYTAWENSHRGDLTVRFYKEDLGMTSKEFTKYRDITHAYSAKKKALRSKDLSAADQKQQRKQAAEEYAKALRETFPSQLAAYLIYENQVQNIAANISANYSALSETKAIRYAVRKIQYDNDLKALGKKELDSRQYRQEKEKLADAYEADLKNIFSDQEYIAFANKREQLNDQRDKATYKMTTSQLAKYKELKKKHAIAVLQIKQSRKDKETKKQKINEAGLNLKSEMKKLLGDKQFIKWEKDNASN